MTGGLDIDGLKEFMPHAFAPMIQALQIEPVTVTPQGARFRVPAGDFVMRTGDIVCGQALASIADTVGVLALFAHNSEQRFMTTVDMTTHFMRPVSRGDLEIEAIILSNGRRMATVRVEARSAGENFLTPIFWSLFGVPNFLSVFGVPQINDVADI